MTFTIQEINQIEDLSALRGEWHNLWRRTPGASFFLSLEWLEAVWEHSIFDQSLRVLIVYEKDKIFGILPFVIRRESRRLGTTRVLTYPLNDWGPYYGPISKNPQKTLHAGLQYLLNSPRDWDLMELRWTPPEVADSAKTIEVFSSLGMEFCTSLRHRTSLIDLETSWEEYLKSRSKNWRSHYRRRHKRLAQAGTFEYVRYRPGGEAQSDCDPCFDLYDSCVELAAKSWQGSSETGNTLNHPNVAKLLRAVHVEAARLGCLDLNLLFLDDKPISFAYNYVYEGHVFALRLGYDPEMSRLGPGNLIEDLAIEDSFSRGDRIYELGPDAEESKLSQRTRVEPILQHTYYPPTAILSQLMRLKAIAGEWTQSFTTQTSP